MAEPNPLDMLTGVMEQARARLRSVVPEYAPSFEPRVLQVAAPLVRSIFAAWDSVKPALDAIGGQVALIASDPAWSPAERDRRIAAAVSGARAKVETGLATITADAAKLER